ncbi:hypothetical protein FB565_000886 [Actinoplanes lutulentus]|uniref:Uncharacterized protein n=1 Tax=Actinoplanes lutulentus TaxID=1287878 RepID=A0A327ZM27_9ACTN|nr:hypothetical protein [Actinoplanes lutulentus]MBB2941182.1 hypothetical protein [Actinoplanes lutulentus]RAK43491.1 hypothetical protein B0I29_101621 [Actinoplanes lutulentus]
MLAPLAAPGYLLAYDMVFVPKQPLRWDLVVPSATLPRAVPLDALVSLATQVVPGWLLQRIVLAAVLLLAAIGAGRLVPAQRSGTRLVAAVAYAWTPYLAERLLLGQWGLLLAYASLPWIAGSATRVREGDRRALLALLGFGALASVTPTGGVLALLTTVVMAARRSVLSAVAIAGVALLNTPWLLATALTDADARSDPDGVAAFAARAENWSGTLGSLLGTGGIWNAQTTLPSRESLLAPVGTLVVLLLALGGATALRDRWPGGAAIRLLVLAGGGFLVAAFVLLPGGRTVLEWLVGTVPGAGLLRDGQKFVLPYALLLCLAMALGAERAAAALSDRFSGRIVLAGALLLPVAIQPDLAFGAGDRLRPVPYPEDFAVVARLVGEAPGPVLSLPFSAYHTYSWNLGRTVLDPLPRYLDADVVTDDRLVVGNIVVTGEDHRAAAARQALKTGTPLASLGLRWVVVQRVAGKSEVPAAALTGLRLVYDGPYLDLYENTLRTEVTTW